MTAIRGDRPREEPRFAQWWRHLAQLLDTPAMQDGTWAPGRVWPDYLAPEGLPPGTTQDAQWGRTLIAPGRGIAPTEQLSDYLRIVRFVVVHEVNDYQPKPPVVFDALVPLERMADETKRLLDGYQPPPFLEMLVAFRVKREVPPQTAPQWDSAQKVWWLSSTFKFEAAR